MDAELREKVYKYLDGLYAKGEIATMGKIVLTFPQLTQLDAAEVLLDWAETKLLP